MLEITKNTVNRRAKDDVINKDNRIEVSKKRQKNNIDPDGSTLVITKINSIPYEELQNRVTSVQVARDGLENSISILEKMKELVYSDNKTESLNKKRFEGLKKELDIEKQQLDGTIKELRDFKDNKILNKVINQDNDKIETTKKSHLELIKSLKSVPDLNTIHKGLSAERVASLLS